MLRIVFQFLKNVNNFTPAAEGHGLWPWMNASRQWTGDVAPLGREVGATDFARGAPPKTFEREKY
jgi:hypothetical protein